MRDLTRGTSAQSQAQLERQTLELWERLYQAWVTSVVSAPAVGPVVDAAGVASAWNLWIQRVQNSTDLFAVDMIKVSVLKMSTRQPSSIFPGWMFAVVIVSCVKGLLGASQTILFGVSVFLFPATVAWSHRKYHIPWRK